MSKDNFNLNFHQTFQPELVHMKKLLRLCGTDEWLSKEDISDMTGIPTGKSSGKVEPHIEYLKYMGLITADYKDKKYMLSLTKLGEEVMKQDPGFNELLTLLVCHARLTSITGATLWYYVFKKILSNYDATMSKFVFEDELNKAFHPKNMNKFYTPLCGSYDNLFSPLNLVELDKNEGENKVFVNSLVINNKSKEYLFVYAYALLYEWEQTYNDTEIVSDQLYLLNIASTFGMNLLDFDELIEELCEYGLLKKNAQLKPYSIIKLTQAEDLVEKLYSLLK